MLKIGCVIILKIIVKSTINNYTYEYDATEIEIYPRECVIIKKKDKPLIILKEECIEKIEIKEG